MLRGSRQIGTTLPPVQGSSPPQLQHRFPPQHSSLGSQVSRNPRQVLVHVPSTHSSPAAHPDPHATVCSQLLTALPHSLPAQAVPLSGVQHVPLRKTVPLGEAVQRLSFPGPLTMQVRPWQHVWFPSHGCPSPRHFLADDLTWCLPCVF